MQKGGDLEIKGSLVTITCFCECLIMLLIYGFLLHKYANFVCA